MNTNDIITILSIAAGVLAIRCICKLYCREHIVPEGHVGLLYREGVLEDALPIGRHAIWGRRNNVVLIDIRKTIFQVAGQEVLTADNVSVKVSATLITQVVNAVKTAQEVSNYTGHLYSAVQTALRDAVAAVTMDALLAQRCTISAQLRESLAKLVDTIGVHVHEIEVRDVMLPGDLRKAYTDVLRAKQEGLAALQRARGESAALRNLLNAARLVENQPALATLRFIQTMGGASGNQTVVMNDMSAFAPLARKAGKSPPAYET